MKHKRPSPSDIWDKYNLCPPWESAKVAVHRRKLRLELGPKIDQRVQTIVEAVWEEFNDPRNH